MPVGANADAMRHFTSERGMQSVKWHPVRIIASHRDLLWSTEFPMPRFGLGAFVVALETLLAAMLGPSAPQIEFFGKPTAAPYRLAEEQLQSQARHLGMHLS
jgi:ribonucleotide monophosphatase NagD (HAD superfamily)